MIFTSTQYDNGFFTVVVGYKVIDISSSNIQLKANQGVIVPFQKTSEVSEVCVSSGITRHTCGTVCYNVPC